MRAEGPLCMRLDTGLDKQWSMRPMMSIATTPVMSVLAHLGFAIIYDVSLIVVAWKVG